MLVTHTPNAARRRYRFSLKAMFVLLTLVSCLGWVGVQLKWVKDRHEALRWVVTHHGAYTWHGQPANVAGGDEHRESDKGVIHTAYDINPEPPVYKAKAPWSLRPFGEQGINRIEIQPHAKEETPPPGKIAELERLFPEARVSVDPTDEAKVFEFFLKFRR